MRAITFIFGFILAAGTLSLCLAQTYPTNQPESLPAADTTNQDKILPLVAFTDVPITTGIDNLARQVDINYQIDSRCATVLAGSPAEGVPEPTLTFKEGNVSAKGLLIKILSQHGLILKNDPISNVSIITRPELPVRSVDYKLLDLSKIQPLEYVTNGVLPLIAFNDVPMDVGLKNLASKAGPDVIVDRGFDDASYPVLSLRWQNLTAKQALVALCENYGLVIVKGDAPGTVVIKPGAEAHTGNH